MFEETENRSTDADEKTLSPAADDDQSARAHRLAATLAASVPPHLREYDLETLHESTEDHGYRQLFELKDQAIDTVRSVMAAAKPETRLAAANSVLDRIGLHSKNKQQQAENTPISASEFARALSTLGKVFGAADESSTQAIEAHFKEINDE
jgi:hypothetical protein